VAHRRNLRSYSSCVVESTDSTRAAATVGVTEDVFPSFKPFHFSRKMVDDRTRVTRVPRRSTLPDLMSCQWLKAKEGNERRQMEEE
jgi:hypothetical protein